MLTAPEVGNRLASDRDLLNRFVELRKHTEALCFPLQAEDCTVQPVEFVSPPKWHLAHSTWFFETFVLGAFLPAYTPFNDTYPYLFNSYYQAAGERTLRWDRGNMSRPTVAQILDYRRYVDAEMQKLLQIELSTACVNLIELGLQHEMQHQELLFTDIKYILGHNPLLPVYHTRATEDMPEKLQKPGLWIEVPEGIHEIGYAGDGFCFDNELGRHKVYLPAFAVMSSLVLNGEYIEFMKDGGYTDHRYWHAEAWDWIRTQGITCPMYWHRSGTQWNRYTLSGVYPVNMDEPVMHVSYYEASAYSAWKGLRLPTEFEWEAAAAYFQWGQLWEHTASAYQPYPGFKTAPGAVGEYNGKFMSNQMVLRGACRATYPGHSRVTYRNFFHPVMRWQFAGIRLAR